MQYNLHGKTMQYKTIQDDTTQYTRVCSFYTHMSIHMYNYIDYDIFIYMSIYRTISPLTYGSHLNRDLETIDLTTLTALTSKKMQRMNIWNAMEHHHFQWHSSL